MSFVPETIWDALHQGTPFMKAVLPVHSRYCTYLTEEDKEPTPPPPNYKPIPCVYYDIRDQYWYVKIKNKPGSLKKHHYKLGFRSQEDAARYKEEYLAKLANDSDRCRE
ncbi:hypothetical protein [Candidatus Accumulibacter vicinus]|jgi:hypothetical protein|uniref:Uncharacterized protein n=1 Tax=Candidatus Accumulibacter vicinus TaxID=2954382 RepID=A0A084XW34_9PROT|nr:hypothetical protein [Candidatus Accumulibacter vicinus]KFB66678.1 MAG: hypothetical protein CAPSK01_003942 [Candidatus Accumulibacter vicinus]